MRRAGHNSSKQLLSLTKASDYIHRLLHFGYCFTKAYEQRSGHNCVADIEFLQYGDGGDLCDIVVVQTMAGIDLESGIGGMGRRLLNPLER